MSDPRNASNYRRILQYLDDEYLGIKSLSNTVSDLINYCVTTQDAGKKLVTICASTVAVGAACYFTGLISSIMDKWSILLAKIPQWLIISFSGISVKFLF